MNKYVRLGRSPLVADGFGMDEVIIGKGVIAERSLPTASWH